VLFYISDGSELRCLADLVDVLGKIIPALPTFAGSLMAKIEEHPLRVEVEKV
jgi:hypothetical protein